MNEPKPQRYNGALALGITSLVMSCAALGALLTTHTDDRTGDLVGIGMKISFVTVMFACPLGVVAVALGLSSKPLKRDALVGAGLGVAGAGLGGLLGVFDTLVTVFNPHGRPLRNEGRISAARVANDASWVEPDEGHAAIEGLTPSIRSALAAAWLNDARLEHASVATFARLSCDLLAVGAPADLVERALRAALDEVAHARACFALASAYAGTALSAGVLPEAAVSTWRSGARGVLLDELARESFLDGCVGEETAAAIARDAASLASDPCVVRVLRKVADDESRHAALAWDIVVFCIERSPSALTAIRDALSRHARPEPSPSFAGTDLTSHGRLSVAREQAVYAQTALAAQAALQQLHLRSELAPTRAMRSLQRCSSRCWRD